MTLEVPTASYLLEPGADVTAVLGELSAHVDGSVDAPIGPGAGAPTMSTVVDTVDRLLRSAGLDLRLETEPGGAGSPAQLVLLLRERPGLPALRAVVPPARRYLISDLPDGLLRSRLSSIVGVRALLPIVQLRRRELSAAVRDAESKIVVRVAGAELWAVPPGDPSDPLDPSEPAPPFGPSPAVALHGRVELAGVLGYPKPFGRVRDVLATELRLTEASESVVDEAVTAVGGIPQGLSGRLDVGLMPGDRADVAAVRILRWLAHVVESNLQGTVDDLDTEFLHDLRVAVRKSRSALRELKGVFDPDARRAQADALRWIQAVTGPTRDLDVQLLEWDEVASRVPSDRRAHLEPVRELLTSHRQTAYETLAATLQGDEYRRRWSQWRAFLAGDLGPEIQRPDAALPVRDVAGRRIRSVYRRMVRMGDAIDDGSPAQALHDLRKRGKELRYLLEFFGSLWPTSLVKPLVTSLKGLQDVLGTHQDREVQAVQLRALAPGLTTVPEGGADALLAMGSLIDRLELAQHEAREGFAERFAAFKGLEVPV